MATVLKSQPYSIIRSLQRLLFQFLHIVVDVAELLGDADVLRAVRYACAATDAMGGLSLRFNHAVVADEETAAGFLEVFVLCGYRDVSLVDTLIIMCERAWDVDAVWTRHTILTRGAGDEREFHKLVGYALQERVFLFGAGFEGAERG